MTAQLAPSLGGPDELAPRLPPEVVAKWPLGPASPSAVLEATTPEPLGRDGTTTTGSAARTTNSFAAGITTGPPTGISPQSRLRHP